MEPNSPLTTRYPDVVGERDDPDLLRLVADLDELHNAAEPSAGARGAISAALRAKAVGVPGAPLPRVASPGRWVRTMRWAAQRPLAAAMLVLALMLLGGAAFAMEPLLKQVFNMEPGTQQLLELKLAQDVHLVRQMNGFTVTIEKVYADSNRVVIGYTVATPPNHGYAMSLLDPVLTTADGLTLPGGDAMGTGAQNNAQAIIAFFDTSQITSTPASLQLHLSARGLGGMEDAGSPTVHPYQVLGPLDFDFTVAFHPGRVATPHETVTVGGQSMTLERIVVTPSQVRVYLRLDGEDAGWLYGTLTIGDWNSTPGQGNHGPQGVGSTSDGLTVLTYDDSIYDKHGAGTLVVAYANNAQAPHGGPWTFHFTMP
jgi:hypothetical protein